MHDVNIDKLTKSIREIVNESGDIAVYFSRQLRNDTLNAIKKEFSLSHYSSVGKKKILKDNPELKKKLKKIEEMTGKCQRKT